MGRDASQLDRVFHALADPTRRALLARLAEEEATTGGLAEPFELSRPAISKHLKVLGEAGLVARRRRGRHQVYSLEGERMAAAVEWLLGYRRHWRSQLSSLKHYLEEEVE
jgi:DNA-binding transcriptional ArsR family regulator